MRLLTFLAITATCSSALAQADSSFHYFYEPRPMRVGGLVLNLGLSLTLLPEPIVEQEIPAPAFDFQAKYGLANNISLNGSVSTNIFTNVFFAGVQFNYGDDNFSYSFGDGFGAFAGFFDLGGEFDMNTAGAVANIPTIRFGHRFNHVALSLSISGTYILHADTRVGSLEDKGLSSRFNDIYATLAVEQLFFSNVRVSTGLSVTYSRTPYQIWMMYNAFDQYLMLPEFFFSFQL